MAVASMTEKQKIAPIIRRIAVAVGLRLAAEASAQRYGSAHAALGERIVGLLGAFGLPRSLDDLRERYWLGGESSVDALIEGLGHDKKGRVGAPEFVLMRGAGEIEVGVAIAEEDLRGLLG